MELYPKAIGLGLVTDFALGLIVVPMISYPLHITPHSLYFDQWALVTGLISYGAAGCVTAWRSPSRKLLNAGALGLVEIGFGALMASWVPAPLWFNVLAFLLTIPACLAGAFVVLPDPSHLGAVRTKARI